MMKRLLLLLLAASMLTGCAADKDMSRSDITADNSEKTQYIRQEHDYYDNGCIYAVLRGNKFIPYYLDFETMETSIVCSKPNCTHNSSDCLANQLTAAPVFHGGYIYFFTRNEYVEELKAGKREFRMDSSLKRASLETSEVETVCEFHDASPNIGQGYILYGSKLYFHAYDPEPVSDEYGYISWGSSGGTDYVCSIDLDTAEYRNYGSLCANPDPGRQRSSVYLAGCYKNKFYLGYAYLSNSDVTDPGEAEFELSCYEFDPGTETITKSNMPYPHYCDEDTYLYVDEDNNKAYLTYKDREYTFDELLMDPRVSDDGKLFYSGGWYDLDTMIKHIYSSGNTGESSGYKYVAHYDGSYIFSTRNEYAQTVFVKLTEKELLASAHTEE